MGDRFYMQQLKAMKAKGKTDFLQKMDKKPTINKKQLAAMFPFSGMTAMKKEEMEYFLEVVDSGVVEKVDMPESRTKAPYVAAVKKMYDDEDIEGLNKLTIDTLKEILSQ